VSRPLSDSDHALIASEVEKLLSKRAIVETNHLSDGFFSNLFLVPKKTGDLRPVVNLRPLNKFVRTIHFKMESIDYVKHLLHPGEFMATIDLKVVYFSIPIHPTDQKYLRLSWENSLYEFTYLPFGYKLAPRTFTKILKSVYAALRFRGIKVVFYIDDTLVIGKTAEQCSIHSQEVCEFLTPLGYKTNIAKSQLNPSKKITFLGFVIDSESMTLSLPGSKIEKIVSHCKRLLLNSLLLFARSPKFRVC